jgi:hypothetical protein
MPITEFLQSVGELDARTDGNFAQYCVHTESLKSLATFENRGYIAVGLKGIGKSGAFRYLTEIDGAADLCRGINTSNVDVHLTKTDLNCLKAATIFRRTIAFYLLSQIIEEKRIGTKANQSHLQNAKVLVVGIKEKFKKFFGRGGSANVVFAGFGGGFSIGAATKAEKDQFKPIVLDAEAERLLKGICDSGLKVRLVIDDPDRLFSAGAELDAQLIAGICMAAYELSKATPNLKVIVLLKSHAFGAIRKIDEMNNMPADVVTTLHWQRKELRDVIAERARFSNVSLDSVFGEKEFCPDNLDSPLYGLSRNGARDCLRRIELCLKASPRKKVGSKEMEATLRSYATKCRDQMKGVYDGQYPGIFELVEALFSANPDKVFSTKELQNLHQHLILNNEELTELFKERWARQWPTFKAALIESGSIAFMHEDDIILPYEEKYYSDEADTMFNYALVPAFRPLIRGTPSPASRSARR